MNNLKIGIVVADVDEYKPLCEEIEKSNFEPYNFLGRKGHKFVIKTENGSAQVISILCGIGMVNAAAATMHLVDIGCNVILNYGLSGGISGINRGELCLCNRFVEHDFDLTGIGYKPCEKPAQQYIYSCDAQLNNLFSEFLPSAKIGTAVSGDRFVCDEELRTTLKKEFNAMSCDMETAAIAYICSFADVPFACLRRISDDAGADAVASYTEMNTSDDTLLSDYVIEFIKTLINSQFCGRVYEK